MELRSVAGNLWVCAGLLSAVVWTVPIGLECSLQRAALAVPRQAADGGGVWEGSQVAAAWALAAGRSYNPTSELLLLESPQDNCPVPLEQLNAVTSEPEFGAYFITDGALLVVEQSETEGPASIHARAELVVGRLLGTTAHRGHFAAFRFTYTITVADVVPIVQSTVLPVVAFETDAEAAAHLADLAEAAGGGGGGGADFSGINPNWRGHDGVECCMFEAD